MIRVIIPFIITLLLAPFNSFYGMACCRGQAVELDDETTERNQQLVERLNQDDANRYVIELKSGKPIRILRFTTRAEGKFWTLKTANPNDQLISVECNPILEGYQNNDQILCQQWKITGIKKGTSPIIFQEHKKKKVVSEIQRAVTVIE